MPDPSCRRGFLAPEQESSFRESGYLLLNGALDKNRVGTIRDHVLAELKQRKIWSSGKTLSASIRKIPAFQQITRLSASIKLDELHIRMIDKEVLPAVASFIPADSASSLQSQLLVSLPNQGDWRIDGLNWHTDITPMAGRIPGVQVFVLLDDVKPRGGATLALAGSHLLVDRPEMNRRVREVLRYSAGLESAIRGNELSIVEMSGRAGDVYLMDMRMLHTPSINSTNRIRMMATVRYLAA